VGRFDDSRRHLEAALQISPDSAELHGSLGMTLFLAGDLAEASRQYEQALRIDPDLADAHVRFGLLLLRQGRIDEAVDHLARSVATDPGDYSTHYYLGLALARQRRHAEAAEQYETAIDINAGYGPAYIGLARLLATADDPRIRNGRKAVALVETACARRDSPRVTCLHTLAMAYAAEGRFDQATATAEMALDLARRQDDRALLTQIESHLALFRQKRGVHAED
jgi:cytochrome c-type biogenesis protein CcmH/NrfG